MADKTTRWQMTVYESQYGQLASMPPGIAEWGWQDEVCPDTGRAHRQGYFRTSSQQRMSAVIKMLPGIHIEPARNYAALVNYCKKEETRSPGAVPVHQVNDIPNKFVYAEEVADRLVRIQRATPISREDVDILVQMDVSSGRKGVMWIGCDPNWTTMWNKFFDSMIKAALSRQTDRQTETNKPPAEYNEGRTDATEGTQGTEGGEEVL